MYSWLWWLVVAPPVLIFLYALHKDFWCDGCGRYARWLVVIGGEEDTSQRQCRRCGHHKPMSHIGHL